MALSRRPYLLRAMHEWIGDSGFTPHIIVDTAQSGVIVPRAYVKDGKIVLNVSLSATSHLQLGSECVEFDARFGGVVHHVRVPVTAVLGVYARETGEGMVFNEPEPDMPPPQGRELPATEKAVPPAGASRRAQLKLVK